MKKIARFSDIESIDGHRNYYRSLRSGIIYYKDSVLGKFSTGETTIGRAKKFVELRKLTGSGLTAKSAKRIVEGITSPPLSELFSDMIDDIGTDIGESTKGNYKKDWKHSIGPFWNNKTAFDISDEKNHKKFKAWYLENRPKLYARKAIVHFKKFCRWLLKNKHIQLLPDLSLLDEIHKTVEKNAKRIVVGRVYSEDEISAMLASAKTISKNEYFCSRAHLGVLLGVRCGLRKESEALRLKWENIDFKNRIMKVWSMKNHKWRDVPLTQEVLKAFTVQGVFTATNSIWVFPMPSDSTKPISGQIFDKVWHRVKKKANIVGYDDPGKARFHDLRHTFASKTADDGWPPKVACEILDMSLKEYDETYAHASTIKKIEMMEKSFGLTINKEEKS